MTDQMKKSDLRPYFIFIAPCSIAKPLFFVRFRGHVNFCIHQTGIGH